VSVPDCLPVLAVVRSCAIEALDRLRRIP
jgi:hypothetical protein